MNIRIVNQNILSLDDDFYIAHCISGDFTLGAGLAKKINEKYDMSNKLKENYEFKENQFCCYQIGKVFNIVNKNTYKDKATYDNLRMALKDMKLALYYGNVKKLAIPQIGCGKDKLDWNVVIEIIKEEWDKLDIDILVCIL